MAYFIWRAAIRRWRGAVVDLELEWHEGFPPINIVCTPIRDRLPSQLVFCLTPARSPLTDLIWSGSKYDLYSPTAIAMLQDFRVLNETVPAVVRDSHGNVLATDYAYAHVLQCIEALDWKRSDVDVGVGQRGDAYVRHARHLVLNEAAIPEDVTVFRLAEASDLVLVSQDFRDEWKRRSLTGARFDGLDFYPILK